MKKINKLPSLSIFFPAYNEAGNIKEAVKQALAVAPKLAHTFEVIVVNDGSKDETLTVAKKLAAQNPYVKVVSQRNRGYGGALKRGFTESKYEWIFFTDADLQFNISELKKLVNARQNYKAVLGYRKNRAEGKKRQVLAWALKLWNRALLGFPRRIKDIDCAFKLLHKDVLISAEPLMSDGAMISTELLLKMHYQGFSYTQIGVTHYKRRCGTPTGSNITVITKAILDTFKLQRHLLTLSSPALYLRGLAVYLLKIPGHLTFLYQSLI